ncbi:MAG: hypothetical protein AMXMBFR84_43560 [Candidatus Hydrogenedentota bacterium]
MHVLRQSRFSDFSRRQFMQRSAATLAAFAISASAAPPDIAELPLACRLASYGKFQDAAWDHLPTIGVKYLFLNVPTPEELPSIQARFASSNLTPLVMRGAADFATRSCLDALAPQLATCQDLGVRYMFLSPKHGETPKDTVYGYLRELGDLAKAHEVTVTLETHPDLGTNGATHVETMKAIDHPNIRVNFDTGNITYYNHNASAAAELEKVLDYLGTVEFKDHGGGFEEWTFPPLGEGIVDFSAIVRILKNAKYQGPITLEYEGVKGTELDESETKQAIEASITHIRNVWDAE